EKAELFVAIGSLVLERWREASGNSGTEETSTLYTQHSVGLWRRLWVATEDRLEVAHAEGVVVLLLRCLSVIHGFLPSLSQGALLTLLLRVMWARHEYIGMTLACTQGEFGKPGRPWLR